MDYQDLTQNNSAVAPPSASTVTTDLVVPVKTETEQVLNSRDKDVINSAITNRDVPALIDVARVDPTSKNAKLAVDTANHIVKTSNEFATLVAPIEKAGVGTPEGNIAAAKQFQTVKDHPQWGTALISYLMGDKKTALNLVTGGAPTDVIEWGKDGGRYVRTHNSLGETLGIRDKNGNPISEQQASDLGISYNSYDTTIAATNEKENKKARMKAFNEEAEGLTQWAGTLSAHGDLAQQTLDQLEGIKSQIGEKAYKEALKKSGAAFRSEAGQTGSKQNIGTKSATTGSGEDKGASAGGNAQVGGEGAVGVGVKGAVQAGTKSSKSQTGTDQSIVGDTTRSGTESSYTQDQKNFREFARLQGLNDKQIAILLRAHDVSDRISKEQDALSDKAMRPSFISLPSATKLSDQQSQLEAQLLQTLHNREQIQAYRKEFNSAGQDYGKTGTIPNFGEIQRHFIEDNKDHGAITDKYSKLIGEMLDRNSKIKEEPAAPAPTTAAPPPARATAARAASTVGVAPRMSAAEAYRLYQNSLRRQ